jgi:transcriptional regulator with XRE-family HTH domain
MPPPVDPQIEARRLAAALRTAIRLSGVSFRQVERQLELSTGYLSRILAGQIQLRMTHVLAICHIIGVPAGSFFAAVYPPKPPANEPENRLLKGLAQLHAETGQPRDPESLLAELRDFLDELKTQLQTRK